MAVISTFFIALRSANESESGLTTLPRTVRRKNSVLIAVGTVPECHST